jgi:hypothetical protein
MGKLNLEVDGKKYRVSLDSVTVGEDRNIYIMEYKGTQARAEKLEDCCEMTRRVIRNAVALQEAWEGV